MNRIAASQRVTISPARAVLAGSLAQNKARNLLSVLAIALGVALGYAVQLITQAAVNELTLGVQMLAGESDLQIRGPRNGFDEMLFPGIARLPEVAIASPVVEVDAKLAERSDALRIVGVDVFRAGPIQPGLVADTGNRLDLLRSDTLWLSPAAARWLDVSVGDTLNVQVGLRAVPLRIAGLNSAAAQQRFAVMDIAGTQANFDRVGRITRIDLRLKPGVDVLAFRDRLRRQLPAGLFVEQPQVNAAATANVSRSYRINMDVLALVALFTGALLVFSTQALAVVRRRAQLALLRVLGLSRRRLVLLIAAESGLVGAIGAALGLGAGLALARFAVRVVGPDLGSGYFRGIVPTLAPDPIMMTLFFALGIAVAMLGGLLPALEAGRVPPALALKAGDEQRMFARLRAVWPGLILMALGSVAPFLPPVAGLPLFGYVAIALLLVGTLTLMPRLALLLLALLPPPRQVSPQLALAQLRGAPGQATVSLAAIVASVSLMVSMAIMVTSFRHSLDAWLERILPADVYLRAAAVGDSAYITPEDQARIAALPGVRRAEFLREQQLLLDAARPRVVLLARTVEAANPSRQLPLTTAPPALSADAPPPIWVNEAMVDIYGYTPGSVVELPLAGQRARFTVAGVWRDYARPQGAIVIERQRYVALTGDHTLTNAALWLMPGVGLQQISDAIARELPDGARLEIASPGEIRDVSLKIFDRTFAVTYALELAAVLIGMFGLSSSFGALVLSRQREFGMLRHIGMTRRQIGAMLVTEGLLVSGIGLVVGLALGWLISLILIHVVNRQSFHWGMEVSVPWLALGGSAILLLALSTVTALLSGRRAMGTDVIRAVREDW